jgi:hypothetical protein
MCLPGVRQWSREIGLSGKHTDSYNQRADSDTGDGVLDQVRRTSSQQSRRGPHAVVVVGRSEWFAVIVNYDPVQIQAQSHSLSHGGLLRLTHSLRGRNGPCRDGLSTFG